MKKNILFAISSLGLGHASRSLPIIKYYAKNNKNRLFIFSFGNALIFLKDELKSYNNIKFISYIDYPYFQRGNGLFLYYYLLFDSIKTFLMVKRENNFVEKYINKEKIDFIISDGKYGFYSKKIPSFIIMHQVKIILPFLYRLFNFVIDNYQYNIFRKFNCLLIPDFKNEGLAGKLSHNNIVNKLNHEYIGILSNYVHLNKKKDIDYLFIISGYLKSNKNLFINNLIKNSINLKGKKVFVLGETNEIYHNINKKNNIEIYSYVSGKLRNDLMNRSKMVISRSGYTTIMDLIELDKKAVLTPTTNQSEQEYLAKYLSKKGNFVCFEANNNIDLNNLVKKTENSKLFNAEWKTKESLKRINETIKKYLK